MNIRIQVRKYKFELLTLVVDILVLILPFLFPDSLEALVVTIGTLTLSAFVFTYLRTRDKEFYFFSFSRHQDVHGWVGRGDFRLVRNEKAFEITNSDSGFIFPKVSNWDDYKISCDFKITKDSIGCIFLANSLSNYAMAQIQLDKVRPHYRFDGIWIFPKEEEIEFKNRLVAGDWYSLEVFCENRQVRILVSHNNETVNDCTYKLSSGLRVPYKEASGKTREYMHPFDLDFGSIGFRNSGLERALIKNLLVERI